MKVVNAVYPSAEQLGALAGSADTGPIAMLNLLKFRERAHYADGRADDVSGREAYLRYATEMRRIVERDGGRFLFGGSVRGLVVGEVEEVWDDVGIVEYPSAAGFVAIATSPEVQAIGVHREAGLAGQLLIMTDGRGLIELG